MAEQFVQVNTDGTGKKIRTEEVTVSSQTVEQQVITLADSAGNLLLGSKTSTNSIPVVIASDQAAVPVTGTVAIGNLDVALSTRTKPADQQHVIVDSAAAAGGVTGVSLAFGSGLTYGSNVYGGGIYGGFAPGLAPAKYSLPVVLATDQTAVPVVVDSAILQNLVDVNRASLQQLSTLTLMFAAVFSPNVNLGGLMNTQLSPAVTN